MIFLITCLKIFTKYALGSFFIPKHNIFVNYTAVTLVGMFFSEISAFYCCVTVFNASVYLLKLLVEEKLIYSLL